MKTKLKRSIVILLAISIALFLGLGFMWAATPSPEKKEGSKPTGVTKPPESAKKGEKFIIRGREYCYECIDNSECLGCHSNKINERKSDLISARYLKIRN